VVAGARWTALVVAALLVGGVLAGCGGSEDEGTDVEKIVLVSPVGDNELDWTRRAKVVVEEFPRDLGIRVDTVDASQTDDVRGVFEQVADEGNQLIIAHDSRYADTAAEVAEESGVPTLTWGERPDDDAPVAGITVQDKEGGYLAGIVAARAAITSRLGIVVAADGSDWDLATWNRTAGGFIAGARSAVPEVRITYAQVGTEGDADQAEMHDAAKRLLDRGAQMIFALGGNATVGALRAVEENSGESQFISVVGDKADYNRDNFLVAAVMWDTRGLFRQAIRDVRAGTFGKKPYALTLRNRGIWLLPTGRTPNDAYEAALEAQRRIGAGTLDVPEATTSEELEQMLAEDAPSG
jgi:basic membrane protein A and related proteins